MNIVLKKEHLVMLKTTFIIGFITVFLLITTLICSAKLFHFYDQQNPLNLYVKEPIGHDPYFSEENSGLKSIKDQRLNGFYSEESFRQDYIKKNGTVIYDVFQSISPFKSRINLFKKENVNAHLILAGDSQTFGSGVEDNEVFSNILAKKYKEFNTYNLGNLGWSPASTYVIVDRRYGVKLKKYIPEEKGVFVYLMFPYLAARDYGSTDTISFSSGYLTNLEIVNRDLVAQGTFKDSHDLNINLKKLLAILGLDNFYENILIPFLHKGGLQGVRRDQYNFSAYILSRMKRKYLERYPKGKFIVAYCDVLGEDYYNYLLKALVYLNVEVVSFKDEDVCRGLKFYSYSDVHFNKYGHQRISELISQRIIQQNLDLLDMKR